MTLRSGDRVGPFEIVAPLGAGGMGEVYRARDVRLERDIAIKMLHDSTDDRAATRLLREARAASNLNHPHVCHVYDVGESPHGPWIAMEYVPGEPLHKRIPPNGLPQETVVRLGGQIAEALGHAHQHGVIHRDLKTANCVWRTDGAIKVLDFGLAGWSADRIPNEVTREAASATGLSGTPGYMPPEVIRGEPASERSDLWALGVVLYEMAAGRLPFEGATGYELASAILTAPPKPLPPALSDPFKAIVLRLLEKDPTERYGTAGEVAAALAMVRDGAGARADASMPVASRSRRRVGAVAALVAVLVAAGAVAAWWLARTRPIQLDEIELLSTFDGSHSAPALSPDGNFVAFVATDAAGTPQIWVKNLGEGAPVQITSGPVAADRPRWQPSGSAVVFGRRGQGIWTVPALGGTARRLIEQGSNPNFSRDGTRLTWETAAGIWVAAADGTGAQAVSGVPQRFYSVPRMPALSPDGTTIVFFHPEIGPNGDLWIISSAGGSARQLTHDLRDASAPIWTPDGKRIVFSSARNGSRTLWQIDASGGEPVPLTTGAGEDDAPEISSDGTRLLFMNVRNSWQVRLADASGAERTLVERRTELLFPMFSPDGTRIAFFGRAERAVAIFTIGSDGTNLRQLTGGTELNHQPRWSHDGNFVVYYQVTPRLGLRRVPALGGPSEQMFPWEWQRQNAIDFDSSGKQLVYLRLTPPGQPSEPEAAIVRSISTGQERQLPLTLRRPRFSRDGRWIAGVLANGTIAICRSDGPPTEQSTRTASDAVDGAECRTVIRPGPTATPVQWSPDGTRLYFLRGAAPGIAEALWSVRLDGTEELKHRELGNFRPIDRYFDLSAKGDVVWAPAFEGRRELWTARVR
jgi:Tol biopolymer transport system component